MIRDFAIVTLPFPLGEDWGEGGLGKARLRTCLRADTHRQAECRQVHQLFGDKLNTIIEELPACAPVCVRARTGRRSAGRLACAGMAGRNETLAA
jgi:hypothetical protein